VKISSQEKNIRTIFLFFVLTDLMAQISKPVLSQNGTDPTEPGIRFGAYLTNLEPLAS